MKQKCEEREGLAEERSPRQFLLTQETSRKGLFIYVARVATRRECEGCVFGTVAEWSGVLPAQPTPRTQCQPREPSQRHLDRLHVAIKLISRSSRLDSLHKTAIIYLSA